MTVGAHHVVQSVYFFFCMCGDAVSQAAQSFLPGLVRPTAQLSLLLFLTFGILLYGPPNQSCHVDSRKLLSGCVRLDIRQSI